MEKRIISNSDGLVECHTKEQFLYAQLKAMVDCKTIASSVALHLIEDVLLEAEKLYGPTDQIILQSR